MPPHSVRGSVLIVHGLGEHSGRYGCLAARLSAWGWACTAYDQRGHGCSAGAPGRLVRADDLTRDLAVVADYVRHQLPSPLVLLGHSAGGVIAADFVLQQPRSVDALILSSPALDAGLSRFNRLLLLSAERVAPDVALPSRLDIDRLSHDACIVAAYRGDPLVHDRVTARLVRYIVDAGVRVRAAAREWNVPTLLLWSRDDRLVSAAGSAAFAALAPPRLVESHCFPELYHEIFNEPDAEPVFDRVRHWLRRIAAGET